MQMRWLSPLLLTLGLAACGGGEVKPAYRGSEINQAGFGRGLSLRDHSGRAVTLNTFRGKVVVLAFGYTHCPDVCPTTLSDMAEALRRMPDNKAARVQMLFVTLDPLRDTPEVLAGYVPYFHPEFLGLMGSEEEVKTAALEFRVAYRKHQTEGASGYLLDHSAGSYVLDKTGKLRLYLPFGHKPDDIAHDLTLLIQENPA